MAMIPRIQVSVRDVPEVLAEMRHELANLLRLEAGAEARPETARRLREIAATFEAGVSRGDARQSIRERRDHGHR